MSSIYGQCLNCGCLEVALFEHNGFQDLSAMGESEAYPYGGSCEVCIYKPAGWRSATAPSDWVRGTKMEDWFNKKQSIQVATEFEQERRHGQMDYSEFIEGPDEL